MILRRLFALVLTLLVAGAGVSPCTAAAIARAADAAPAQDPHAAHAHSESAGHADQAQSASRAHDSGDCHEPGASIGPQCPCGCTGDAPRAAASSYSAPWGLPTVALPRLEEGDAPAAPGRYARPAPPLPSRIDHVPIAG